MQLIAYGSQRAEVNWGEILNTWIPIGGNDGGGSDESPLWEKEPKQLRSTGVLFQLCILVSDSGFAIFGAFLDGSLLMGDEWRCDVSNSTYVCIYTHIRFDHLYVYVYTSVML